MLNTAPLPGSSRACRPAIDPEIRTLIKRMATANLWGAPRIRGELSKLGIEISEATASQYLRRRRKPPSQTWRSFLDNHPDSLVSVDFWGLRAAASRLIGTKGPQTGRRPVPTEVDRFDPVRRV